MANTRLYEFDVGAETGTQPDAGTPTLSNDLVTLGYLTTAFGKAQRVTGSYGTPYDAVAGTSIAHGLLSDEDLGIIFIQGSGGPVTMTVNPMLAVGTKIGQRLRVIQVSATNTLVLPDNLGVIQNGECLLTAAGSSIEYTWSGAGGWIEIARNML